MRGLDPAGAAVSFIASPSAHGRSGASSQGRIHNLDGFYPQLEAYLKSFCDPEHVRGYDPHDIRGHFALRRGGSENLFGSADMVYLLHSIDELENRTTPEGRREWAKFIQSCQDPDTGWFTRRRGIHRMETSLFKEHSTAYAISALRMLGEEPLHRLESARSIAESRKSTERWLESILWIYVWGGSHQGGGLGSALQMTGDAPEEWFDWYFDWLDREVNPKTGLWQRAPWNALYSRPTRQEMGGAPHFWWVYHHRGRPLPHPDKIVDTCLSLQLANGMWDSRGYTYCVDLDALWSIHRAHLQLRERGTEYRTGDIEDGFERYLSAACDILNQPVALQRLYDGAHKLPGAVIALAEAEKFFRETLGEPRLRTPKPLKQVLDLVSWI